MSYVQFDDFGDRRDRFDVVIVEPVTRIDRDSQRGRQFRSAAQAFEFTR